MIVVVRQTNKEINFFFFEGSRSLTQGYMYGTLHFTIEAYPKPQDV